MTTSKRSQADELVVAARESGELVHDPTGTPYAFVKAPEPGPHREILRIRSRTFRLWLAGRYWRAHGRPAGGQALTDALDVLGSVALFEGPERHVGLRVAKGVGAIYVDLVDALWRSVEIDRLGWRIVDESPIAFRRTRGMLPLPLPVEGGTLDELRDFANVADEDDFKLLVGWLIAALRPSGPYIVLVLTGEQDSAKSTTARLLRLLLDPNEVGDRALPRDEHSMAIAASNSWIASFDNVSTLQDWQSDALARLATGAGFGTRQLYSDDEETLVHVARPLILNGIGGIVTRPDLMDRAIVIDLPAIPDDRRRPEAAFYAEFEAARPRLLGALLAAVSSAFARENEIDIHGLPRMADATKWVTAAEPVLRWPNLAFLTAYRANRADSRALTLDASPLTAPIDLLVADHWSGTATELLHELELRAAQDVVARRDWPRTARILGVELRRLAPDLRRVKQIEVAFERLAGTRTIRLVREGNLASSPSSPSTELVPSDANDDRSHDRTNGAGQHQPILAMPFDRQPEPPSGDLVGDSR